MFEGKGFFDLFDFLVTNIMMPIGGILIAVFAGWVVKTRFSREEFGGRGTIAHSAWLFLVRFVAPVILGFVFVDMAFG